MRVGSTDYIITPPGQRAVGLAYLEQLHEKDHEALCYSGEGRFILPTTALA